MQLFRLSRNMHDWAIGIFRLTGGSTSNYSQMIDNANTEAWGYMTEYP